MTLNTIFDEKNCTIFIEGSIDTLTARELEQAVNEAAPKCEKMRQGQPDPEELSAQCAGDLPFDRLYQGAQHRVNVNFVGCQRAFYSARG